MVKIKTHLENLYRVSPEGKRSRTDCLRLDMNESVSGLPEDFVRSVLSKINPDLLAAYPEYSRLQTKIAHHNKLRTDNICLSNGSDAAIKYIFDAYISPGDKVLLTDPTFAMYPVYCKMFNALSLTVEYGYDFEFPYRAFIDRISDEVKLAVIVNPNNPTGSVLEYDGLMEIVKKAARHNVLVIVDEAYFYFYPKTVIKEVKNFKNLVVLRTFSKLCGLAAVRLGYAAADSAIIENMRKVRPTFDINGLAVFLAEKLLDQPKIIRESIKEMNCGKKYLAAKLSEAGIEHRDGNANFILIKCGPMVKEIVRLLAKKDILVQGDFKQPFLKGYVRVTVGGASSMRHFWENFYDILKNNGDKRIL